jgi:hypothetical protein
MGSFTGSLLQAVPFRCHKFVLIFIVLMLNCRPWAFARAALRVGVKKALISFPLMRVTPCLSVFYIAFAMLC